MWYSFLSLYCTTALNRHCETTVDLGYEYLGFFRFHHVSSVLVRVLVSFRQKSIFRTASLLLKRLHPMGSNERCQRLRRPHGVRSSKCQFFSDQMPQLGQLGQFLSKHLPVPDLHHSLALWQLPQQLPAKLLQLLHQLSRGPARGVWPTLVMSSPKHHMEMFPRILQGIARISQGQQGSMWFFKPPVGILVLVNKSDPDILVQPMSRVQRLKCSSMLEWRHRSGYF